MASRPIECHFPQPGWVEQDAEQIWSAQLESAKEVMARLGLTGSDIVAAGITNQRETTVVWDKRTGKPVAPAIVWQCRRTADRCQRLRETKAGELVTQKTGLIVDAYFSASKVEWILENVAGARERAEAGDLLCGTVDAWLIWKLSEGQAHVTDFTNASRTMLMNLETGQWDEELLREFRIPASMLPAIVASSDSVATIASHFFGGEIAISGIAGDQQAALAGQACFRAGLSKNTYGTGCFALLHTGNARPVSKNKLLATRAASIDATSQYAVEGSIFIAGAAMQWLRDKVGLLASAAESEAIAASIPSTQGVYVVPAFVGLGAPYWQADTRATISGLTLGTGKAEIVRATLESMAYQTKELIEAMQADSGERLQELRVDGGAANNNFLMQFQADILGTPVVRPVETETTVFGAACLAGLAAGYWKGLEEVNRFWKADRVFEPKMSAEEREGLWAGWKQAVARTRLT